MNTRKNALDSIEKFVNSEDKGMLIVGEKQYEKHGMVMKYIEENFENAKILFRIDIMQNIKGYSILNEIPRSGEAIRIGRNFYEFDSLLSQTWRKTSRNFDFCIAYPIDCVRGAGKLDSIANLNAAKNISKIFYISCTGFKEDDFSILSSYYSSCAVYDAE